MPDKKGVAFTPEYADIIDEVVRRVLDTPQFPPKPTNNQRQFPSLPPLWKNNHESECPAYGAFEVQDMTTNESGRLVLQGTRLSGDESVMIGFNHHYALEAGGTSPCFIAGMARTLYADGNGSNGTGYGPKADSWQLEQGAGFMALGTVPDTDDQMFVMPAIGNGKAIWIRFELDEALATTDATVDVTVDAYNLGSNPDPSDSGLTIDNAPASSNYKYEGSSGDKGEALLQNDGTYMIIQLECA